MSSLQADGKRDENLVVDSTQTQTGTKSKQAARNDLIKSLPKLSANLNNVTLSDHVSIDDNLKGRKPSKIIPSYDLQQNEQRTIAHGTKAKATIPLTEALMNDFQQFAKKHFPQSYAPEVPFNTDKSSMNNFSIKPFFKRIESPEDLSKVVV